MASPAVTPMSPDSGAPPPGAGASGPPPPAVAAAADVTHDSSGPTQTLIKLSLDAKKASEDTPEIAPMMREVQNQCRMATMKLIQKRQQTAQATPQI